MKGIIRQFLRALACIALSTISPLWPTAAGAQAFNFALIGDLGYYPEEGQDKWVENVMAEINKDPSLAFVAHVGDLSRPRHACLNEFLTQRLAQFQASAHPLVYTPGDNDWGDCHDKQGVKGGDPLERLANLRNMFFQGERSLGKRTMPLLRQSQTPAFAKFRENVRWDINGVTFVTLHIIGSNNNHGRTPEADAEYAERNKANLVWLSAAFAHAKANNSRAVMVIQQGNLFPEYPPFPGPRDQVSGLVETRALLLKETIAFARPVVLVHGDSHYFRIDNPFAQRPPRGKAGTPGLENFKRVETFGTPDHHWLKVIADPNDSDVFAFQPRMVRANFVKR
jgi:hypothetical protein